MFMVIYKLHVHKGADASLDLEMDLRNAQLPWHMMLYGITCDRCFTLLLRGWRLEFSGVFDIRPSPPPVSRGLGGQWWLIL